MLLSGVYYVTVPPNSGGLVLEDPRRHDVFALGDPQTASPEPVVNGYPFSSSFRIEPSEGDFVLFPGWTPHRVEKSAFDDDSTVRISMSFNFVGSWDSVSNLHFLCQ